MGLERERRGVESMADPIEANYTPDGDDWTVAVKGRGQTLTGRAPGLIAARDKADQLVEKLAPEEPGTARWCTCWRATRSSSRPRT